MRAVVQKRGDRGVAVDDFKPEQAESIHQRVEDHAETLWNILDPNGAGMIATLEAMCYTCIGCLGTLEQKIDFVFNLFDFNNGTCSKGHVKLLNTYAHFFRRRYQLR